MPHLHHAHGPNQARHRLVFGCSAGLPLPSPRPSCPPQLNWAFSMLDPPLGWTCCLGGAQSCLFYLQGLTTAVLTPSMLLEARGVINERNEMTNKHIKWLSLTDNKEIEDSFLTVLFSWLCNCYCPCQKTWGSSSASGVKPVSSCRIHCES